MDFNIDISSQNWFQNRRAKAKHQNPQEPRFDLSTDEEALDYPASTTLFSSAPYERISEARLRTHFPSPEHPPFAPDEFVTNLEIGDIQFINHLEQSRNDPNVNSNFGGHELLQTNFSNAIASDPMWPAHNIYGFSMPKVPTPTVVEHETFEWSPVSPTDLTNQSHSIGFPQTQGQPLYLNTHDGHLIGNPSSQTLATASSECGDHAALITPPQEASPMPGLNEGIFARRGSNSSELADNFDTIHLQQAKFGLGLYENPVSSTPDLAPETGLATPNISPDTITAKSPFSLGRDLASRRKRPRPAALQPEPARSFSYAGPSTASPHLRVSSPGPGRLSPVRRIKSTGNSLNVATGRIVKPGPIAVQKSPRSFESCFQLEKPSHSQPNVCVPAPNHHARLVNTHGHLPSNTHLSQHPPTSWPDYPSQYSAVGSTWNPNANNDSSINYPAGLSLPPSPPNQSNEYPPSHSSHGENQEYNYHCPPQSAPPHLTTFFDGSPPISQHSYIHGAWPAPSATQTEPYQVEHHMPIPLRPNHMMHHSHSSSFNHFPGPTQNYHGYPAGIGPFQPYQPFNGLSVPARKELDIKIEKGPPPPKELLQTSQENKVYSFNNSTPIDFAPPTSSKR